MTHSNERQSNMPTQHPVWIVHSFVRTYSTRTSKELQL
jgi:hypothetical protein